MVVADHYGHHSFLPYGKLYSIIVYTESTLLINTHNNDSVTQNNWLILTGASNHKQMRCELYFNGGVVSQSLFDFSGSP